MNRFFRKTLSIILFVYAAAFVVIFVYSILSFHGIYVKAAAEETMGDGYGYLLSLADDQGILAERADSPEILSAFKLKWILGNSIILFSRYFTAIHLTGVFLCFSLIFPYTNNQTDSKLIFFGSLGKSIVLLLVLTFVYTAVMEGAVPVIKERLEKQRLRSEIAAEMFTKGNAALVNGDYDSSTGYFSAYMDIDPENDLIKKVLEWTKARMMVKEEKIKTGSESSNVKKEVGFYKDAEKFYSSEDYFSSFYYAYLASVTEEGSLKKKAMRLMALSREKLDKLDSLEKDKKRHQLFIKKMNALEDLRKGDTYDAYYAFKTLMTEYPGEKDVELFFKESEKSIRKNFFFIEELERIRNFEGVSDILYTVEKPDGVISIVSIGKYIETEKGRYFFNVEVMDLDGNRGLIAHYKAPYGKLSKDGYITFNAIEKDRKKLYGPVYYMGENNSERIDAEKLVPDPEDLSILSNRGMADTGFSLVRLLKMRKIADKYGYLKKAIDAEIISRIKLPFSFFILSLFSVGVGWFFRNRKDKLPILSLPFIVIIPFVLNRLILLFGYSSDLLNTYILFKTGFIPALSVMLAVQGLLLFISLVFISENER